VIKELPLEKSCLNVSIETLIPLLSRPATHLHALKFWDSALSLFISGRSSPLARKKKKKKKGPIVMRTVLKKERGGEVFSGWIVTVT
jgi:hypothetical protein